MNLAIVSCVWARPGNLEKTLGMLSAQTDRDFDLYLVNNNPALAGFVEAAVSGFPRATVLQRDNSLGPAVRSETMHGLVGTHDFFMTLDDDAVFGPDLVGTWKAHARPDTLMGWTGFRFRRGENYWLRDRVGRFGWAHYLWGSNLLVPAAAVEDRALLGIPPRYVHCDDLWLCHHAARVARLDVRVGPCVDLKIDVDGLDTYTSQHSVKVDCLEELRSSGWKV